MFYTYIQTSLKNTNTKPTANKPKREIIDFYIIIIHVQIFIYHKEESTGALARIGWIKCKKILVRIYGLTEKPTTTNKYKTKKHVQFYSAVCLCVRV